MSSVKVLFLALALAIAAEPVDAQPRGPANQPRSARARGDRWFVSAHGGIQTGTSTNQRSTFVANSEDGTITADYPGAIAFCVDALIGRRVSGPWGFAGGVSYSTGSGSASIDAAVPHPFFDDRDRLVSGEADGISRTETAIHMQLYYERPIANRTRLRVFGGPSVIFVDQEMVDRVEVDETYPFDEATFRSAPTVRATGSGAGIHAGVEVSRVLTTRTAIEGLVRYTYAPVDLNAGDGRTVSSHGGGLQAGAGLRVVF
jgi:hypothetical protein